MAIEIKKTSWENGVKKKIGIVMACVTIISIAFIAILVAYIGFPWQKVVAETAQASEVTRNADTVDNNYSSVRNGSTNITQTSKQENTTKVSETRQFVEKMGVGINIGNSLDVCDWNKKFKIASDAENYETTWGNVSITEGLIKMIADEGYGTIRIPVTYMNHIDAEGNVDPNWLGRVSEVVDMVIDNDMYCIIDIHHDTGNDGWIKASNKSYNDNHERVANMIVQIATYFKDYDDHLILEGFNEMVDDKNRWENVPADSLKVFNSWNQIFVDLVRSTGSNNATRFLLVNTYAASCDDRNIEYFELPKDTVEDRILVGVHGYIGYDKLDSGFESIKKLYDRGYAIVISEFGSSGQSKVDRAAYTSDYAKKAAEIGACPILWDDGSNAKKASDIKNFAIMDRKNLKWYFPEIADALKDGN